jgi:hypothetical protein
MIRKRMPSFRFIIHAAQHEPDRPLMTSRREWRWLRFASKASDLKIDQTD